MRHLLSVTALLMTGILALAEDITVISPTSVLEGKILTGIELPFSAYQYEEGDRQNDNIVMVEISKITDHGVSKPLNARVLCVASIVPDTNRIRLKTRTISFLLEKTPGNTQTHTGPMEGQVIGSDGILGIAIESAMLSANVHQLNGCVQFAEPQDAVKNDVKAMNQSVPGACKIASPDGAPEVATGCAVFVPPRMPLSQRVTLKNGGIISVVSSGSVVVSK